MSERWYVRAPGAPKRAIKVTCARAAPPTSRHDGVCTIGTFKLSSKFKKGKKKINNCITLLFKEKKNSKQEV